MDFNSLLVMDRKYLGVSIPNRDFGGFQLNICSIILPPGFVSIPNRDFGGFQQVIEFFLNPKLKFQSLIGILVDFNFVLNHFDKPLVSFNP